MRRWLVVAAVVVASLGVFAYLQHTEPPWYARLWYPLRYTSIVRGHAANYHLDAALLAAVIEAESKFDPNAHSAAGAIGFFIADRIGANTRSERTLTMMEAFWIGCAQAVALVPGVSRSGITITVALLLGLRRPEAARFVFLLAIPAILGAAASEAPHLLRAGASGDTAMLFAIGIVTSAIVGASRPEQLDATLAAADLTLDAEAIAACESVWWGLPRRPAGR